MAFSRPMQQGRCVPKWISLRGTSLTCLNGPGSGSKDNLLDTVWLATSSSQIKELWGQVNALLEIKPTALEEKALKIAPVQEE